MLNVHNQSADRYKKVPFEPHLTGRGDNFRKRSNTNKIRDAIKL